MGKFGGENQSSHRKSQQAQCKYIYNVASILILGTSWDQTICGGLDMNLYLIGENTVAIIIELMDRLNHYHYCTVYLHNR
jgi:hypothetical protein